MMFSVWTDLKWLDNDDKIVAGGAVDSWMTVWLAAWMTDWLSGLCIAYSVGHITERTPANMHIWMCPCVNCKVCVLVVYRKLYSKWHLWLRLRPLNCVCVCVLFPALAHANVYCCCYIFLLFYTLKLSCYVCTGQHWIRGNSIKSWANGSLSPHLYMCEFSTWRTQVLSRIYRRQHCRHISTNDNITAHNVN